MHEKDQKSDIGVLLFKYNGALPFLYYNHVKLMVYHSFTGHKIVVHLSLHKFTDVDQSDYMLYLTDQSKVSCNI